MLDKKEITAIYKDRKRRKRKDQQRAKLINARTKERPPPGAKVRSKQSIGTKAGKEHLQEYPGR